MTQVSIFKEKYSRYTPSTNQGWAEKEQRINDESSHSIHKTKETSFNHQTKTFKVHTIN